MEMKKTALITAVIMTFALNTGAKAAQSELVTKYLEAVDSKNALKMSAIIAENKDKIPAEVKALLEEAAKPEITPEDKEAKLYTAELLASGLKDETGDFTMLKEVKKAVFNSKLSGAPVRLKAENGIHVLQTTHVMVKHDSAEEAKNIFQPDNIIIKKGETVRWENKDTLAHVLISMPVIGTGGIKATRIEPGQSFEFKFTAAGEYFYICYIHKGMIGKVTVEE
ncbi:MAG: cupredoxin domain-containing protein [Deltaproteobacteria bacterium]|nr:cupredoxin domain-containing protein [Deltaproteobacteria bacterium]